MVRPVQINGLNAAISSVAAIVFLLPFVLVANVVKLLIVVLVRIRFGPKASLVLGCDSATATKPMRTVDSLLNLFLTLDGVVTRAQVRDRLSEKLIDLKNPDGSWVHPKFRTSFLWFLGYKIQFLELHKYDVDEHFVYFNGPDDRPLLCADDSAVEDVLEKIGTQEVFPDDPERPPWKFYVFYRNLYSAGNTSASDQQDDSKQGSKRARVATCFVMHIDHTIIDGGSLSMTIMPKLLDMDAEADPTVMFQNLKPFSRWRKAVMNLQGFLLIPLAVYRGTFSGNDGVGGDNNPLHGRSGKREGRYFLAPKEIPLSKFTEIRVGTDVKINSILAACLYRALNRFSKDISAEQDGGEPSTASSRKWTWTVNMAQSLWVPGDRIELINRTSALPYTCDSEEVGSPDPLSALPLVKNTMEDPSRMAFAWSLGCFMKVILNTIPVQLWDNILVPIVRTTGVMSNVRGPDHVQRSMDFNVHQMTAYITMWENLDVGMIAGSYAGKLTVTFVGRRGSFKDREDLRKLLNHFEMEVDELHAAALAAKKKQD